MDGEFTVRTMQLLSVLSARQWLVLPPIATLVTIMLFSPMTLVEWGPSLHVVGHYAPVEADQAEPLSLGTSSTNDLRLTESLIPDRLGTLLPLTDDGSSFTYQHASSKRGAVWTRAVGKTSTEDASVDFVRLPEGDDARILVGEDGGKREVAKDVCDAEGRQGEVGSTRWAKADILTGEGLWMPDPDGQMRMVQVPLDNGAHRVIGGATLAVLPDSQGHPETWLLPGAWDPAACKGEMTCLEDLRKEAEALRQESKASKLRADDIPPSLDEALRDGWGGGEGAPSAVRATTTSRSWVRVGDAPARPILPGGQLGSRFDVGDRKVHVFRRKMGEESTPLSLHVLRRWGDRIGDFIKAPPPVLVGRSSVDGDDTFVVDCDELTSCPADESTCSQGPAGKKELKDRGWLVAGNGVHYRVHSRDAGDAAEPNTLELALEAPPSGRARLFSSLAAGRLKSYNARIPVGKCEDDRATVLRGRTDEEVTGKEAPAAGPGLLRSSVEHVAYLPLPRWAARLRPAVSDKGHQTVDVARACVLAGGTLQLTRFDPRTDEPHTREVVNGQKVRIAGHVLQYTNHSPTPEQVLPLYGFLVGITLFIMAALRRLQQAIGRTLPRSMAIPVLAVQVLFVVGTMLQMHLAAHQQLLGSPDYVHRHIITGWLAVAVFLGAVEFGCGYREVNRWVTGSRVLGSLAAGLAGLSLHAALDKLYWDVFGAPIDEVLAGQMVFDGVVWNLAFTVSATVLLVALAVGAYRASRVEDPLAQPRAWLNHGVQRLRELWDRYAESSVVVALGRALAFVRGLRQGLERRVEDGRTALDGDWRAHLKKQGAWSALSALWLLCVFFWDVLVPRRGSSDAEAAFGTLWLRLAGLLLAFGAFLAVVNGDARAFAGFDLKLSEFAALFLGLGFGGVLAGFSDQGGHAWWRVPLRALLWVLLFEGGLILLYGLRSDLGPLMVVIPALVVVVSFWALEWTPSGSYAGNVYLRIRHKLGVVFVIGALTVVSGVGALVVLDRMQDTLTDLPFIGSSLSRTIDRVGTFTQSWYTRPGWWTTRAQWIAGGFFGTEVFVSNLHSDLAYTAVMQTFGWWSALLTLLLYAAIFGTHVYLGQWLQYLSGALRSREDALADQLYARKPKYVPPLRDAVGALAHRTSAVAFLSVFAGSYVAMEAFIHIGTCFNTFLQTGITLPWLSSGGSAAVGFAMLVGGALGFAATTLAELPRGDREWGSWEEKIKRSIEEATDV